MKHLFKSVAILGMSACILTGGAIAACAQTPDITVPETGFTVVAHKSGDCGSHHADASLVAQYRDADGTVQEYTICAEGGEVNGKKGVLEQVHSVFPVYAGDAYTGTLDNGERVLTLVCYNTEDSSVHTRSTVAYVEAAALEGYDAYLVGSDGTETRLETRRVGSRECFDIDLRDGAALLHLVPTDGQ